MIASFTLLWLRLRAAGEFGENCRMKCEMSARGGATKSDLERPLSLARSDLQLNFHPATVRASAVDAPCGAV